jgi:hypothetical protein
MDPASYLAALRATPSEPWALEKLYHAALEGLSRWCQAQERIEPPLRFPPSMFGAEDRFELAADLRALLPADDGSRARSVTWAYLFWWSSPTTRDLPNPYEPLLEFLHHGGTFSTEDIFLEICSASGDRCGIPIRKRNTNVA